MTTASVGTGVSGQKGLFNCCCGGDPHDRFPKLASFIDYLLGLKARAPLDVLAKHLQGLDITAADLGAACVFGTNGYRRNIIAASEHFELLVLTWRSGHCTPIHDHRGVSCAFRVVQGEGTEIRFEVTPSGLVCPVSAIKMPEGYVCAAADEDIHQVVNMQGAGLDVVTLHCYTPRITKMHTYQFKTSAGAERADDDVNVYEC